jgi:magnesium chelatase subunit D
VTLPGYPFTAVVRHNAAKRAFTLLAIEPGLRGVLIASHSGTDARTLARGFGELLSASAAVRFQSHADPLAGSEPETDVVELPLNTSEDGLLGGLDLERTIATGTRQISAGLLARANGGVLYADDINRLGGAAAHVAHALDSRTVRVEREGVSAIHDADFVFAGTFDSDEGEPVSLLRDRVGLIVESPAECPAEDRIEVVDRAFRFDQDPFTFVDDFAIETAQLNGAIEEARARLPRVRVSQDQRRQIAQLAMTLGVEGNRADAFALKAARANAALAGRDAVIEDDIVIAIQLVLAPRATTQPSRERGEQPDEHSAPESPEAHALPEVEDCGSDSKPGAIEDMIVQAIDAQLPIGLLSPTQRTRRPARAGRRYTASLSTRGRYVRSNVDRPPDARIAIDATLRAAAPFQLRRQRPDALTRKQSFDAGALRGSRSPRVRRVKIEPGDLRFKEFKHRSGILFIFAVDASGSMALNRMAQAKGALTRLLQQAYLHRDKVALLSFRGAKSDVLLAPTRSVELAKRLVDALPAGGGTPLSAGLVKAIELGRFARLRGTPQAMLVLLTDGRANVALGEAPNRAMIDEELRQLGALLGSEEISSVVVDTKSRFVSSGEGEALARLLGARYCYLPRSNAGAVYDAITSITRRPSEN